jgi:hypothetical protein
VKEFPSPKWQWSLPLYILSVWSFTPLILQNDVLGNYSPEFFTLAKAGGDGIFA